MSKDQYKQKGRNEHEVYCRKLSEAAAWNYRNASEECARPEISCDDCAINIALTENPMHTLVSLRNAVSRIIEERSRS